MAEKKEYTATIFKDGNWWVGWVDNVPGINCQEKTREELKNSIAHCIKTYENLNMNEFFVSENAERYSVTL